MTAQRHLFPPGPAGHGLTTNQRTVYDAVQASGGMTAAQAGSLIHGHERCVYCASAGRSVLEALKARKLVRRRRTGIYEPLTRPEPFGEFPDGF